MSTSSIARYTARHALLLVSALAALASTASAQEPLDPLRASLARLSEVGCFRIAFDGAFEQQGERLSEIHADGALAGGTTYEIDSTFNLIGEVNVLRVVRIGDRQWEWEDAGTGWRATQPGGDMISQSVAGLISSLSEVRDVTEGAIQALDGAECRGYNFVLPPGVATIQGLAVEGRGTLWVRQADGLPVQLDLTIATPIGSTGKATVVLSDHGVPVEIVPPGLGGASADGGAPLRGGTLTAAMEDREAVHWTLEASGEGEAVVASILPAGAASTALDVYILPGRPAAVARLRAGDKILGEMIVDRDVMCEYFIPPEGDEEPEWTCQQIDPSDGEAPWRLHTQILEQAVGDRPLVPDPAAPADGFQWYRFDPAEGGMSGLFIPLVREELLASESEMTGQVQLGMPFSELRGIRLTIQGLTAAGEKLAATESYRFSYELTDQERADLERAFAEARARVDAQTLGRQARGAELAGLLEQVARECAWTIDDADALRIKLSRLERAEGVLAAWVLGADGGVLAAVGEDGGRPPAIEALGEYREGSPTSARDLGEGDPRLMVAPVVNRDGALQGYLVARWTAR